MAHWHTLILHPSVAVVFPKNRFVSYKIPLYFRFKIAMPPFANLQNIFCAYLDRRMVIFDKKFAIIFTPIKYDRRSYNLFLVSHKKQGNFYVRHIFLRKLSPKEYFNEILPINPNRILIHIIWWINFEDDRNIRTTNAAIASVFDMYWCTKRAVLSV